LNGAEGLALDASGRIWVVNQNAPNVEAFAPGSSGNVAPVVTIAGANTGMTLSPNARPGYLALDSAGNIYVSIFAVNTISVFAANASGNVAPIRSIVGASTTLTEPLGVLVGPTGILYVANFQGASITVYAPGATGNAAPTATISGALTGFNQPIGVSF
jgi:streptogramin lyase